MINIYADIGNTAFKILKNNTIHYLMDKNDCSKFFEEHKAIIKKVFYSSVNDEHERQLLNTLTQNNLEAQNINDIIKNNNIVDISAVHGIGNDRVLGVLGGLQFENPPFITVDFGTCTTVNLVMPPQKIIGGAILPGLQTQLRSLQNVNSILTTEITANIELSDGNSTKKAVANGIVSASVGGVSFYLDEQIQRNMLREDIPVLIVGGWSKFLLKFFPDRFNIKHYDNLAVFGVKSLIEK
jgi:pantothenate kinase type III